MARDRKMSTVVKTGPSHVAGFVTLEAGDRVNLGPDFPLVFGGAISFGADDDRVEIFHNGVQQVLKGKTPRFFSRLLGRKATPDLQMPLIVQGSAPLLVVARSTRTGVSALVLDSGSQGYNALACEGPTDSNQEGLVKFAWDGETEFRCFAYFTYNTDFDSERAEGEFEVSKGKVALTLVDGQEILMEWDSFRQNAFDWFELEIERDDWKRVEIVSLELA